MMNKHKEIFVSSPSMPALEDYITYLKQIWDNKWLTNNGRLHQELESSLKDYLGVPYISLFSNGTLALICAIQALRLTGEVITTPYSFVATTHALWWNGLSPVFVDIEPNYLNIDPEKIESAITERTTAIMPVHVYGNPCQVDKIDQIAKKHNLKVIYDAAHAFHVNKNGNSILNYGDLSVLSFHATKVFSTIEGGAIICHSEEMKHHIDNLKNFGFRGETLVEEPGINAKLNEFQAAYGLLQLKQVDSFIEKRKLISNTYRTHLNNIEGIRYLNDMEGINHAYSYFPIFINAEKYGMHRDELYEELKKENIFARRYFYPLISNFETYKGLSSSEKMNLPIANKIAEEVICLPLHTNLEENDIQYICNLIRTKKKSSIV